MSLKITSLTDYKANIMPPKKSEIKITIEAYGKSFTLNCEKQLFGRFKVKVGRALSDKMPSATLTEIFEIGRKWAVKQHNMNG